MQKVACAAVNRRANGARPRKSNAPAAFVSSTLDRMRTLLLLAGAGVLLAQQPVLYHRGTVNAASLAPFGLPNAPIARGSIFTVFGENLGPAQSQTVSAFPLGTEFGGVSLSVTQSRVTTQAFPIFVSAGQINAVLPSSVTAGPATLRLKYQTLTSNAITILIANSAPGIFAISSGGYGPGIVQNYVSATSEPINSLTAQPRRDRSSSSGVPGSDRLRFPITSRPRPAMSAHP